MPSPASFSDFIKKGFQSRLVDFLSADVSTESQEFLEYQNKLRNSLPSILLDELMNDLLLHLSEQRESDLMLRALQLLLSARTRRLRLYPFDYARNAEGNSLITQALTLIQSRKPNLTHLELNYDYLNDFYLRGCLKEFPSLKSLTIKSFSIEDSMMQNILQFCPALKELNLIIDRLNFSELKIKSWPKHETLSVFRIKNLSYFYYFIEPTTSEEISKKLPNLQILKTNNNFLNLILSKEIAQNLKSLLTLTRTPLRALETLYKIRPETDTICLQFLGRNSPVEFLPNFLRELSISVCFHPAKLWHILQNCGSSFKSLSIGVTGEVNVFRILKLCPDLEFLYLDMYEYLAVQVDQVVPHSKLRHFRIHQVSAYSIPIFSGLTSIQVVEIGICRLHSPSDLENLISAFRNIKTLHIYLECNFTLHCIQEIIRRCHQLEELVLPSRNDHFNVQDVQSFLQINHFNLKLINSDAYRSIHKHSLLFGSGLNELLYAIS